MGERMNTVEYIQKKFEISPEQKSPIEIRGIGRKHLADLFFELNFKCGAEIGVEAGLYSEIICKANPSVELYLVDAWQWLEHRYWVTKRRVEKYYKETLDRVAPFNTHIIKKFSADAVKDFADGSLDFVYIDADHRFDATLHDITEWSKKVRSGGIISGHDFIDRKGETTHKVKQAVCHYVKVNNIDPWFLLGAKNKAPGEYRDDSRSWMWVKS
jgi:hypothetical protein